MGNKLEFIGAEKQGFSVFLLSLTLITFWYSSFVSGGTMIISDHLKPGYHNKRLEVDDSQILFVVFWISGEALLCDSCLQCCC